MILNYKQYFPFNGEPTYFREKIQNCIHSYPGTFINRYDEDFNKLLSLLIDRRKKHSIRQDAHDRWKAGMKIQHAYGMRTKNYKCFAESVCSSIQIIEIKEMTISSDYTYIYAVPEHPLKIDITQSRLFKTLTVFVDGRPLSIEEIQTLAINDGFNNMMDFFKWFNEPFKGKIIHWTDLKY